MGTETHILVVDDDARVARLLAHYLERNNYAVTTAGTLAEAETLVKDNAFALIILDLQLPDGDGLLLARSLKASSEIPIIILSGKDDTVDKVLGLEMGADDYVTKPFEERELLARVHAVLRRHTTDRNTAGAAAPGETIVFDGWRLDRAANEFYTPDGEQVPLTHYEYRLLELLVTRPSRTLSRDQILEHLAERDWSPYDRSVDVLMAKLRKKIESDPRNPHYLKTVRGMGYKFTATTQTL